MKQHFPRRSIGFIILITLCLIGCRKHEYPEGPQGPAGPAYVGTITGHVTLFDQYGTKLFYQLNRATVSIDGMNKSTTTDSTGKFNFANLATGTYSLTYTDSSFGTFKSQNIQLLSGINTRDAKLSKIPTFNVDAPVVVIDTINMINKDTTQYVKIRGTIAADKKTRTIIVFVGNISSISSDPSTYLLSYTKTIPSNVKDAAFFLQIPNYDLNNAMLTPGKTAYFAIYGIPTGLTTYEDLNTGRTVFPSLSLVPVIVSHIMP